MYLLRLITFLLVCLLGVCVVESKNNHKDKKKTEELTTIRPFFPDAEEPYMRNDNDGLISPIFFGQNSSEYTDAGVRLLSLDNFVLPMVSPLATRVKQDTLLETNEMLDTPPAGPGASYTPLSAGLERNKHGAARPLMCGDYYLNPGEKVSIMSPYYPVKYPNNFRCRWNLQTASDATFVMVCSFFKLAKGDVLSTYLIGKGQPLKKFTGLTIPKTLKNYHMDNYFIRLIFGSDKKQNNNGFSCQITAKPKEVEEPSTTIEATTEPEPTYPDTTAEPEPPQTPAPTQPPSAPLSDPECGIVNRAANRIVNGQFADLHEYPWMAYLEIVWDDGHNQLCGGSLVYNQWILTAAHCVLRKRGDGSQWMPEVKVTLAMTQRSKPNSDGAFTVTAASIEIHPKLSFTYDLTLIKLPSPVEYSDSVRPVCLPNRFMNNRNYTGMVMALSGWGKTEKGVISDKLRELGRYGIESAVCQKVFGQYITEHHFCTSGVDVKHICLGDSGGPVMTIEEGNRYFLTGVVSFVATKDCLGEYPDGHTSVTHFLDWIQTTTGKDIQ